MINNNNTNNNIKTNRVEETIQKNIDLTRKNFSCTICLEYFENPILTNCGHSFCKKCIESYMGTKRTQTCPLCKKTMNVRSLKKSDTMSDIVSKVKQLEKTFQTELTSSLKSINKDKPQLLEVPSKRKRNSSIESTNINNNLKKLKAVEEPAKTNKLCDQTIIDFDEENEMKTKKVQDWLDKNKNPTSSLSSSPPAHSSKVDLDKNDGNITHLQPLADSTNIMTEQRPVKNAKSPVIKIIPNIILDTCFDSVDSTCSTSSKNLIIHEPTNLDIPDVINKNNNEPIAQPVPNNENEPEKLSENPLKFTKEPSTNDANLVQPANKIQKNETPKNITRKFVFNSLNNKNNSKNQEQQQPNIEEVPAIVYVNENNEILSREINKDRKPIRFLKLGKLKHQINQQEENLKKITKDASTNTSFTVSKSNASTQTHNTEFSFDYNKFENYLFNKVYLLLEDELLNEEFPNISQQDSINNKSKIVFTNVVPNSPPTQPRQLYKTYLNTNSLCDDTISDTTNSEATIILPSDSISFNKQKAATNLNQSNVMNIRRTKPPLKKALPQLEFLDSSRIVNEDKLSDTESNNNKDDEMIIIDTPVKEKTFSDSLTMEQMREIDRTLSRSANRMELVNSKIIVENSMVRYENSFDGTTNNNNNTTIIIENNENDKSISIIPDTVKIIQDTSRIIPDTAKMLPIQDENKIISDTVKMLPIQDTVKIIPDTVKMVPVQDTVKMIPDTVNSIPDTVVNITVIPDTINKNVQDFENEDSAKSSNEKQNNYRNHSFINSMLNSSVSNTMLMMPAPLLSLSNSMSLDQNRSVMNRPPPKASDILGTSYLSSTTLNQSVSNKSSYENKSNDLNETAVNIGQDLNQIKPNNKKYEFVGSLLKPDMKIMLKNFADTINAIVKNDVTDNTTHLVVDSTDDLYCGVTSKYLKAISRKIWIISFKWIINCVKQGEIIQEENYEIIGDSIFKMHNAPKRARLSTSFLFENYEFLFVGKFADDTINIEEITDLSVRNGAFVVRKVKEFGSAKLKTRVVLYDEKLKKFSQKEIDIMEKNNIHTVAKSWLLDSLACYNVKEMKDYQNFEE